MMRTYFHDFVRDDGSPISVEYSFRGGSPPSYSPMSGADGGGGCEIEIVSVMPNTPEFDVLCRRQLDLTLTPFGKSRSPTMMSTDDHEELEDIDKQIAAAAVNLTDAEIDRIESWIAEHHIEEPDDDDIF